MYYGSLSPHSVSTAVTTCHSPTHVENTGRDEENLCRGQLPPLTQHFSSPSSLLVPSFLRHLLLVKAAEAIVTSQTAESGGPRDPTPTSSSRCGDLAAFCCGMHGHVDGRAVAAVSLFSSRKAYLNETRVSFTISLLHFDGGFDRLCVAGGGRFCHPKPSSVALHTQRLLRS